MKPEAFLTRRELASILRVHPRTIRRHEADPGFPKPVFQERPARFAVRAVVAWLGAAGIDLDAEDLIRETRLASGGMPSTHAERD